MQDESKHEKPFVKKALKRGFLAIKLVMVAKKGWPDRTIIGKVGSLPVIFFIEFKDGNNDTSAHQRKWKRILEKLGFKYYVCYSLKEAETALETEIKSAESRQKRIKR